MAATSASSQQPTTQAVTPVQASALLGSISGTVTDADGALIPEAHVTIAVAGHREREAIADAAGEFHFDGVAAGSFTLTTTAHGLAPVATAGELRAGEDLGLPPIALIVATSTTSVDVSKTSEELAELEIRGQEQQRIFGVAPNFFVSYDWHAQPLTTKQKFELTRKTILDPINLLIVGGTAGIQQWQNNYKGYGQGAQGYGKRYGAAYAGLAIGTILGGAVLPSLFHQDPRYFYKGEGTWKSRAAYALSTAVRQRGDNGKWQVAYASMLGDLATGAISNAYYPASDRNGPWLTIDNGLLSIALDGLGNLAQEFLFHKVSTGVGKP